MKKMKRVGLSNKRKRGIEEERNANFEEPIASTKCYHYITA
jgi:hypothetical protein